MVLEAELRQNDSSLARPIDQRHAGVDAFCSVTAEPYPARVTAYRVILGRRKDPGDA